MLRLLKLKFPLTDIRESVRVRIPEVGRGMADIWDIIGVITFKENENLYKHDIKYGILK